MTSEEIHWVAGLFEGEGCISTRNKKGSTVYLLLTMTDLDIVNRFHAIVGCGAVRQVKPTGGRKPAWMWQAGKKADVARILCAMAPLLGERRRAKALEAADRLLLNTGRGGPGKARK